MRSLFTFTIVFSAAAALPALPADLKILSPGDRSVLRGTVEFKIRPEHAPGERIVGNPIIAIQNEQGAPVETLRSMRSQGSPTCSVSLDTTRLKDGRYLAIVTYKSLMAGKVLETEQELTLGVRNSPGRPARLAAQAEEREYRTDESCLVVTKLTDARGRPLPGARVAFKVDRGEVDQPAGIADSDGEAPVSVSSDTAGSVTLTMTPDGLPPVTRVIRFSAP